MAIFKRELKITTEEQGDEIKHAALSPLLGDYFDGEINVLPAVENNIYGEIGPQEIPLGNSVANSFYLLETPVKRPPIFGEAKLVGMDLHVKHSNINYKQENNLADIEVYKFDKEIPSLGVFPKLSSDGSKVIVGSTGPSTSKMVEKFDGQTGWGGIENLNTTSKSSSSRRSDDDLYITLEDAWYIQENESSGVPDGNQHADGLSSKSSFRKQYCHWDDNIGAYIMPLEKTGYIRKDMLSPKNGMRWSKDFAISRAYYDYEFAVAEDREKDFKRPVVKHTGDWRTTLTKETEFADAPVITTEHTMLSDVRHTPNVLGTVKEDGQDVNVLFGESTPVFSTEGEPPSGQACVMRNRWTSRLDKEHKFSFGETSIPYQSQMIQMRLPYPLHIARQIDTDQALDSMCVSIKFSILALTKYHRSNVNQGLKADGSASAVTGWEFGAWEDKWPNVGNYGHECQEGHNLLRSIIMMTSTSPPAQDECFAQYIYRLNKTGVSPGNPNHIADQYNTTANCKQYYNGIGFVRWGQGASDDTEEGEIKIINSGKTLTGNDSQYWQSNCVTPVSTKGKNFGPYTNPPFIKKATTGNGGEFVLNTATIPANDATVPLSSPTDKVRIGSYILNDADGGGNQIRFVPHTEQHGSGSRSSTKIYFDRTVSIVGNSTYDSNGGKFMVKFVEGDMNGYIAKIASSTAESGTGSGDDAAYITLDDSVYQTINQSDEFIIINGKWPKTSVSGKDYMREKPCYVESINTGLDGNAVESFEMSSSTGTGPDSAERVGGSDKIVFNRGYPYPDAIESVVGPGNKKLMKTEEWYTLKMFFNDRSERHDGTSVTEGGYIRYVLLDSNNKVVWTRRQQHQGIAQTEEAVGGDQNTNNGYAFPSYLTLWVNNVAVNGATGEGSNKECVESKGPTQQGKSHALWKTDSDMDTEVTLAVSSISCEGYEPDTKNASLIGSTTREEIKISESTDAPLIDTVTGQSVGTGDDVAKGWFPPAGSLAVHNTDYSDVASLNLPEAIGEGMPTYLDDATTPKIAPTYLSFGLTDILRNDIESGIMKEDLHFYMGNYTVGNGTQNDITDDTKRIRIRDYGTDGYEGLNGVDNNTSDVIAFVSTDTDAVAMGQWFIKRDTNLSADPHINNLCVFGGAETGQKLSVDGFTKKGFWTLKSGVQTMDTVLNSATWTKRENPAFSTKIVKVDDASNGRITVSNPRVLEAWEDEEYIIYRAGLPWSVTAARDTGVKIQAQNPANLSENIQLKTGTFNKQFLNRASERWLHDLYISPYRYWIILEIYNQAENGDAILPTKSYDYCTVHGGTARNSIPPTSAKLGVTYNETLYSDTTVNSNRWHVTKGSMGGLIHDATDYGYGSKAQGDSDKFSSDSETGSGYINKYTPAKGWNTINLNPYIEQETRLSRKGEKINLALVASQESKGSSTVLGLKYYDTGLGEDVDGNLIDKTKGRNEPYFTFYYEDELPTIDNFRVQPDEANPFLPRFKWESGDDDLWYGFIMIDNKEIKHQYENAVAHIPLNESTDELTHLSSQRYGTSGKNISGPTLLPYRLYKYDGSTDSESKPSRYAYAKNTNAGADITSIGTYGWTGQQTEEGLAGPALNCTGNSTDQGISTSRFIEFYAAGSKSGGGLHPTSRSTAKGMARQGGYYQPNDNFSISLIFSCDDISAQRTLLSKYNEYEIYIGTDGLVYAKLWPASGTTVLLTSSSIIQTGETPYNVIVTFAEGLSTGNAKLYINGKLEDQTGKKTTAGSENNWKNGQKLARTFATISANGLDDNSNTTGTSLTIGCQGVAAGAGPAVGTNPHSGTLEEIVLYDTVIYPVVPTTGEMLGLTPFKELTSNSDIATGQTVGAKLFVKDYHNIRGTSVSEVASSSLISIKKGGLGLYTS